MISRRKARLRALDPADEIAAVFGDAAGLGGDEARPRYSFSRAILA